MARHGRWKTRLGSVLAAVGIVATGADARAYDMGWATSGPPKQAEQPDMVPIRITSSTPALRVDVFRGKEDTQPVFQCTAPCEAMAEPGRYRLFVHETDGTSSGSRSVTVSGPSAFVLDPRATWQRPVGLALGVGGVIAVVTGLVLLTASIDICMEECAQRRTPSYATEGAYLLLGGAIVTPIGWVLFGKSFRPAIDVLPYRSPSNRAALGPLRRPMTLGLHVDF